MNADISIFTLAICYFIAAIFMVSAAHKLLRAHAFRNSLAGYGLLAENLIKPISIILATIEIGIALSLLTSVGIKIAALFAIIMFIAYAAMLGYGLTSGRASKGCGCEWGDSPQPIKPWMIWRNAILVLLLMLTLLIGPIPTLTLFNMSNALGMAAAIFIIYSSMTGIFSVGHRIKLIRKGV